MKIKITIGRIVLLFLITVCIYNLYFFHTTVVNMEEMTIFYACSIILMVLTYIIGLIIFIILIREVDWNKIFNKGFTIDLNRWKDKNNN